MCRGKQAESAFIHRDRENRDQSDSPERIGLRFDELYPAVLGFAPRMPIGDGLDTLLILFTSLHALSLGLASVDAE